MRLNFAYPSTLALVVLCLSGAAFATYDTTRTNVEKLLVQVSSGETCVVGGDLERGAGEIRSKFKDQATAVLAETVELVADMSACEYDPADDRSVSHGALRRALCRMQLASGHHNYRPLTLFVAAPFDLSAPYTREFGGKLHVCVKVTNLGDR